MGDPVTLSKVDKAVGEASVLLAYLANFTSRGPTAREEIAQRRKRSPDLRGVLDSMSAAILAVEAEAPATIRNVSRLARAYTALGNGADLRTFRRIFDAATTSIEKMGSLCADCSDAYKDIVSSMGSYALMSSRGFDNSRKMFDAVSAKFEAVRGDAFAELDKTIADGSAVSVSFPSDPIARIVLSQLPPGLTVSDEQFAEFMNVPDPTSPRLAYESFELFLNHAKQDPGITFDQQNDLMELRDTVVRNIDDWANQRDSVTADQGYGKVSKEMRASGSEAWEAIRSMNKFGSAIIAASKPATGAAYSAMMEVMWAYGQCMALELEASHDEIPINDIRNRVEAGLEHRWEPAETPDTMPSFMMGSRNPDISETERAFVATDSAKSDIDSAPQWREDETDDPGDPTPDDQRDTARGDDRQ